MLCSTGFYIASPLLPVKNKETIYLISKNLKHYGPFLWIEFNCLKAAEPLRGDSLLFTT